MNDAERMACIEAWSSGSWGDRLGEIVRICIAVEKAVSHPPAPTTPLTDARLETMWLNGPECETLMEKLIWFARAVLAAQQEKK